MADATENSKSEELPLLSATLSENNDAEIGREGRRSWTVDAALSHIGMGRFQAFMLFVLGIAYMGDAGEALLLSFLGPDVKCEWDISFVAESCITAAVFLGMATGAMTFGYLGDRIGRKRAVIGVVAMSALFGVLSAAASNVWMLVACRYVVGVGIGGFALFLSMYSEFLPKNQRGTALATYQLFWGAGAVVTAGLAWLLMPHYHWRGLTLAAAAPLVLLLLFLPFIPESPRYFVVNGQRENAMAVLQYVAKMNGKSLPSNFELVNTIESDGEKATRSHFLQQFRNLFKPPLHRITAILWPNWAAIAVGYYSIVMLTTSVQAGDGDDQSCKDGHVVFSDRDYRDVIIDACAEIPGIVFAVVTVEYFGRKRLLVFSWMASALSMLLLPITSSLYTVFLFTGRLFSMASFTALMVLAPELYPSSCRSFAIGAGSLVSRGGAALSPFIARAMYDAYGLVFVALLEGILFLIVGIITLLISVETKGKSMKDTVVELENAIREDSHRTGNSIPS